MGNSETLDSMADKSIEDMKLTDLIETEVLQKMQDEFSEMVCMAALITDENGTPLTVGSNFSRFCTDFCRKSPKGRERCEQCDKMGAVTALEQGSPVYYYCHANLVDFAAPIMLGGRMIGSFIGGQVLPDKPNLTMMRKIAKEIEVDEEEFIKAAEETAIVPRDVIARATKFIYGYAEVLSEIYDKDDLAHVGWYYIPVANKAPLWMDPYLNENINVYMISYVVPLYINGESVGIIGMDIDFNQITDIADSLTLFQNGFAFIVNGSGAILHHKDIETGTQLSDYNEGELAEMEKFLSDERNENDSILEYFFNGEKNMMAYSPLNNGMHLALTAPLTGDYVRRKRDYL